MKAHGNHTDFTQATHGVFRLHVSYFRCRQ